MGVSEKIGTPPSPIPTGFFSSLAPIFRLPLLSESVEQAIISVKLSTNTIPHGSQNIQYDVFYAVKFLCSPLLVLD